MQLTASLLFLPCHARSIQFGGESDLSDIDEDEAEVPSPTSRSRSLSTGPSARRQARPQSEDDEEEEDEEEEAAASEDDEDAAPADGEYSAEREGGQQARGESALAKLKFQRKKKSAREEVGEGEGGEEGEPRKKKKKTKAKETEPEEDEVVDPEVAARRALNARLDAIIKPAKTRTGGNKKRRGEQDDDLDAMNDEAIVLLRNKMFQAADADIEENEANRFAINKLRLLPTVVEMMQKSTLAESLVENGVLEAVKRWLEPLPDRSLPAVNIQRPLFEILCTLSIETSALKSSGLGKIVYFYTKCKRVEPFIARMANQLVSDWMRPIIRRSKVFADKEFGAPDPVSASASSSTRRRVGTGGGAVRTQDERNEGIARRHARIPEMLTASFKVAPARDARDRAAQAGAQGQGQGQGATGVTSKMKEYKKKLVASQQASRRV